MRSVAVKNSEQDSSELPTCTALMQDEKNNCVTVKVEKCETSPVVSRYGRTHKPKISEDFLPTDKKVGAILGLSPKTRSPPSRDASQSLFSSTNKAVEKGRVVYELLRDEKKISKRGRKPKLKLTGSLPVHKKLGQDGVESHVKASAELKSEVSTSDKTRDYDKVKIKVEDFIDNTTVTIDKKDDAEEKEIMSPDVTSSVDDNVLSESIVNQTPTPSSKIVDCGWVPGDLAWARIGGHPFWPCMVAMDPRTGVYTKIKRVGRGLSAVQRSLHVQFFGDNGRHSWVSTNCVIKFEGKDGLQNFADKVLSEIKKKDKKFSSAFVIRPSSKKHWDLAVQEAEEALPKSNPERIRFFDENFPPEMYMDELAKKDDTSMDEEGGKKQSQAMKRKRNSIDPDEKPHKQMKSDPDISETRIKVEKDTSVDCVVNTQRKQRHKKHTRKESEPYDFRIFAERYSKHASEIHPGMNNENLKKLMMRMWSAMDESEKSVYKKDRKYESEELSAEDDSSDNDNDNDNSSDSTRESTPSLAFSGTSQKKSGGLFRGTRQEKVCQICLKPGNTIKCKGPCLGVFHMDCVKLPQVKQEPCESEVRKKRGRPKSLKSETETSESEDVQANGNTCTDKIKDNKKQKEIKSAQVNKEEITNHGQTKSLKKQNKAATGSEDFHVNGSTSSDNMKDIEKEEDLSCENEKETSDEEENKLSKYDVEENGEFRCKDCAENRTPVCFECNLDKDPKTNCDDRIRCGNGHCGKFYHLECVKTWPQASCLGSSKKQVNGNKVIAAPEGSKNQVLTCPQHVCHTCASDDPRNATMRFNHERLVRCIQCPTAYHTGNYCVPAGTEILTGSQIICPRHYEPPNKGSHHVNAAWCFICAMVGGSLICCDLCPTSFHAECLRIAAPEGGYICEDCDTGRYPLYGEVVWVKLGAYRWWPAQILFPNQIPDNVKNLPQRRGEFAVRFFGSHDHYWVNRGRVFLYQEGDTGHKSAKKTSVDGLFQKALTEAAEAHKQIKVERSMREAEARPGMKPPSYIRIKYNKPVGNVRVYEVDPSSMTPCECDPESKNPCGVDSDCLNRILMVECTPGVCAAGERCGNQCFVKREYPPLEPFRTESRGWGLRALKTLRKGEFVIEYVGEMIDEAEYRLRLDSKHREKDENYYFLTIDNHRLLDAGPKGNVARFMNHSCQPNCVTQKWTVNGDTRVGLFALQDIPMGKELTFNYNLECVGPDKKPCMCGAPNCSGYIGVKVSKLVEDDKKTKLGRQDQQRSAKRKKKSKFSKAVEGECFECGDGGELLLCDNKTCPKGYHLSCAKRKTWPKGKWLCPWHLCDVCERRTSKRCAYCPRSFCMQHAEGNIRLSSSQGMVCQKHDDSPVKTESDAYNGILEDVKLCLEGIQKNAGIDNEETAKKDTLTSISEDKVPLQETVASRKTIPTQSEVGIEDNKLDLNSTTPKLSEVGIEDNKLDLNSRTPKQTEVGIKDIKLDLNSTNPKQSEVVIEDNKLDLNSDASVSESPVQNMSSSLLLDGSTPVKRKRGRPRKYALPSPPTAAQYTVPKTPKTPKTNEIKTPEFVPKSVDEGTIKKKRGRKRKHPLPDTPESNTEIQSISTVQRVTEEKKNVEGTPGKEPNSSPKLSSAESSTNLITPRTSSRKRQPSEKLAAYMNSRTKSSKKLKNSTLDKFFIKLDNNRTTDLGKSDTNQLSKKFDIKGDKKHSNSSKAPSAVLNKSSSSPNKTPDSRVSKNISKSPKNAIVKSGNNFSRKLEKPNLTESNKLHGSKLEKSVNKSDKFYLTNREGIHTAKGVKNRTLNLDKKSINKTTKNYVVSKSDVSTPMGFKSYLKRTPKRTILQRVDHKPAISTFSLDGNKQPTDITRVNSLSIASTSKKSENDGQSVFRKAGEIGMNNISTNSGILESFDDSESQYFGDSANGTMTTIPIKFSEFDQINDEFMVRSGSPDEEPVETPTDLDSEFITLHNDETTQKLSEDGKYQILTNMVPDSLDIDKQSSVLMGVES